MKRSMAGGIARRKPMTQLLKRLWPEEEGANLSEYGLLLLLMSLLALAGMRGLASGVDHAYTKASTQMVTSGGGIDSITTDPVGDVYTNQSNLPSTAHQTGPVGSSNTIDGTKTEVGNSAK
jgi:Flp pilus assembly pilin Flp